MLSEVENPCSQGGQGDCEEDCVDSGGRGGGHSLLLLRGLDKEGCAGAWIQGLAQLGGSDGEAWAQREFLLFDVPSGLLGHNDLCELLCAMGQ